MDATIAGLKTGHLLVAILFLGDQLLKLALRITQDELDTFLLAQEASIDAGLARVRCQRTFGWTWD